LKSQLLPDLELNSAMTELKKDRDPKQKELEHTQRLVEEAMAARKIADFNRESLETVSKKWGEANALVKVHEAKFISATGEIAQLEAKVEKLERQEHSRALANEQLVLENDKLKQMNAQLEEAAKNETKSSEVIMSKLDTAEQRIQRLGEILANSMDELITVRKNLREELKAQIEKSSQSEKEERQKAERQVEELSERKNLREFEARMETSLQFEKEERQKAEREVKDLKAALLAKAPVKREQEWDI
jgi:chromosome segregation ATPase